LRVAVLLCDQAEHAYEKDNDASGLHSARCIRGLALKKACYLRGLARKARPKLKAAVSSFTEALSHCTQEVHTQLLPLVAEEYAVYDTDIHWERGRVYHAQGDYRNAIEDYSQVLNAEPTRLEAILNRGAAYCETREEDMGLKDFESARRLNQTVKTAWMVEHYLGSHYLKKGDLDKAVHHSSEAIQLEGKSCSYDVRAAAYEAKGSEWSEQAVADRNAASSQRLFETMGYHPVDTIPIL